MSRRPKPVAHLHTSSELLHKNDCVHKYLLFQKPDGIFTIHMENQRIMDVDFIRGGDALTIGTVLIGRVEHVLPQMNGAFLRITASGEKAFLPLDKVTDPHPCNRTADGRVLAGDEYALEIKKLAQKQKLIEVALSDTTQTHHALYEVLRKASPDPLSMLALHLQDGFVSASDDLEIVTDDAALFEQILPRATALSVKARLYDDRMISLDKVYALDTRLKEVSSMKVQMKSGAFLYIEQTQAMCVIDVNSGKAMKKTDPESYYLQINLEAAAEIFYQLHVRNISGIIMIDFINMKEDENRAALTGVLKTGAAEAAVRTRFVDFTRLGLAEMTREKRDLPLQEKLKFWFDK